MLIITLVIVVFFALLLLVFFGISLLVGAPRAPGVAPQAGYHRRAL